MGGVTEVKPGQNEYKYLLVFVDTVSGWVETFPTRLEMPQVTVKKLLQGLLLRFGTPLVMGSNNGLAFIGRISQLLTKVLGKLRKLHCAYRPQ